MTQSTKYLISLTKSYLKGEKVHLDESIDWEKLYSVAKEQNLISVIYCVISSSDNANIIPKNILDATQECFYEYIYRYEKQKSAIELLKGTLCGSKIHYVLFKGAVIKELYPVPESRPMGDIDILINECDYEKAKLALENIGFKCRASGGYIKEFEKDGIITELHTKIIVNNEQYKSVSNFYSNAINCAKFVGFEGFFDIDYHFAYSVAHIAHHILFYGAGIRLVFDLAVMIEKENINFDTVFKYLDEMNLGIFGQNILSIANKWFELNLEFNDVNEKLEKFICSYGVFGTKNRNASSVLLRRELENSKNLSSFKTKIRILFPSYNKMKSLPYISFLNDNKKYLLPFAWGYRFQYNFIHKRKFAINSLLKLNNEKTKKQAKDEIKMFEEIGLL